ncbi:MAG: efflux RND transporter periplasmic adaptor subunit [Bacteroidota bacterium]
MKKNKTLKILLIIAAVLVVVALIGKKAGWFGKGPLTKVAVETVQRRTIVETITANGRIQPETEVKISPDVSGEIVELDVAEGDSVKKDVLLLKIKQDFYISSRDRVNASVNTAKANLSNARANQTQTEAQFKQQELSYKRSKQLHDEGVLSDADFETAKTQYDVAAAQVEASKQSVSSASFSVKSTEASLKEAEENLRKTTIYAPIDGMIYGLKVELGERVVGTGQMAGTEILRIADLNRMEVQVEVNENDIVRVNLGDTATIEIDSYIGTNFKGIVTEIANSANTTGTSLDQVTSFNVKIFILPESYAELIKSGKAGQYPFRPGMTATVEIHTETHYNVLSVPIQAVTTRTDTTKAIAIKDPTQPGQDDEETATAIPREELMEVVFTVDQQTVSLRKVKTGIQDKNYIEILSGPEENESVIIAPYNAISKKLEDGIQVEVVAKEDLFKETKKK